MNKRKTPHKTNRTIKINYSFYHADQEEWKLLIGLIGLVVIMILFIILMFEIHFYSISLLVPPVLSVLAFGYYLFKYIKIRTRRTSQIRAHNMTVARGKKIVGTIVSFRTIDIGNSTSEKGFNYTVEYEDPMGGETISIMTPVAIQSSMYITEKDLPLKVNIYVDGRMHVVDSIINPPIGKMVARHTFRIFVGIILPIIAIITSIIVISCLLYARMSKY